VLADAELEYEERVDPSLWFLVRLLDRVDEHVLVWTTTPWTIPANVAVAVAPELEYTLVQVQPSTGPPVSAWVATEALDRLTSTDLPSSLSLPPNAPTCSGTDLAGTSYAHPWPESGAAEDVTRVILADFVTAAAGTGVVHCAPAHGADDADACRAASAPPGVDVLADDGTLVPYVGPTLAGRECWTVEPTVSAGLREAHAHVATVPYAHSVPIDWRTKQPVVTRATAQWFLRVPKEAALAALDDVQFSPKSGRSRLASFLRTRGDWCISRQRSWGVPIPVFADEAGDGSLVLDESIIRHVASLVREHGSDVWWTTEDDDDLLPASFRGQGLKRQWDTLDVWFDSGSAWHAVADGKRADIVIEGSDQHRGWFQTSLLTSLASGRSGAPYRHVVTHGMVLDGKGRKMSKSLGNVVDPAQLIATHGADALRAWVGEVDARRDVSASEALFAVARAKVKKTRNTFRFLLGVLGTNVEESKRAGEVVAYADLLPLDRLLLARVFDATRRIADRYSVADTKGAAVDLHSLAAVDVSAVWGSAVRDRLYCEAAGSPGRASALAAAQGALIGLLRAAAPLLPALTDEVWSHTVRTFGTLPDADSDASDASSSSSSLPPPHRDFLTESPSQPLPVAWHIENLEAVAGPALAVRTAANGLADTARKASTLGSSSDASLFLSGPALPHLLSPSSLFSTPTDLAELCSVSEVIVGSEREREGEGGGVPEGVKVLGSTDILISPGSLSLSLSHRPPWLSLSSLLETPGGEGRHTVWEV
jgi:isoleucyl-tRNA synthetase